MINPIDFLTALNYQVFVHKGQDTFELVNATTDWFDSIYCEALDIPLEAVDKKQTLYSLGEIFPFIDNFLIDAVPFWSAQEEPSMDSGIWTEMGQDKVEYQLSAKAMNSQGQALLIIENISAHFPEKHRVYQEMRNLALKNEKLLVELNRRQRSLQQEILKTYEASRSLNSLEKLCKDHIAAVMICQSDGKVEVANNALINIYQNDPTNKESYSSILDQWLSEANQLYPEIKAKINSGRYWEGSFETAAHDGESKWINLSITPVTGKNQSTEHFVCIAYDMTEYQSGGDSLEDIPEYDLTTRLPNRRYFWRKLEEEVTLHDSSHLEFSLLLIDIDNFKYINDEFGHVVADQILKTIGGRLISSVKQSDFVLHLGGDEFAIILNMSATKSDLEAITQRVKEIINEPMVVSEALLNLSCCIGAATYISTMGDANDFFRKVDLALLLAKKDGKNCHKIYHKSMKEQPQRFKVEQELRIAFLQKQFELHYQPQVVFSTKDEARFEALLRWNHPEKGLMAADKFIDILETCDLVVPLGYWLIRQACQHINLLKESNINAKIAINVSAKQLHAPNFFSEFTEIIEQEKTPPENLELEITEHCFVGEKPETIKLLSELRNKGIMIAIDDFGSGYSSLSYLKRLPVDVLKVDRTFITELPGDKESEAIVTSILQLANTLQLDVVVEGVEEVEQLEFLITLGCDCVQGFLFSPAIQFEKIPTVLQKLAKQSSPFRVLSGRS